MVEDDVSSTQNVINIAIVLEEAPVLKEGPDLLLGFLFDLTMAYPRDVKYTFEVKVLLQGAVCKEKFLMTHQRFFIFF